MRNVALTKIAGVSAIMATVTLVPWFAFPFVAPAIGIDFPQSRELADWATFKVEHSSIVRTVDWLVIVSLMFETVAVIGFFYVLRAVGPLTWIGLAAWLTGLQLVIFEHVVVLGVDASLMPQYLSSSESSRPAIEVLASTLNRVRLTAAIVGNTLILGVAVPTFAVAALLSQRVPRWIAWLGIAVGVLKWLPLNYWPSPAFVGFMLWLVAMGIVWLRLPVESSREEARVSLR